jgi:hypothetical protein
MALRMRVLSPDRTLNPSSGKGGAKMELNAFLGSDAALLLFSGLGLVATGLAIMRDIPVQKQVVEQPVSADR